uniref:Uncharacterized protein LOC101503185 n=1 Tax=Cicer arietinum TaxID=3827 RepID=A0A1S3DXA6_CICAR|nr:uncharacterized protein LOC101503185 [Cicer arietinum]
MEENVPEPPQMDEDVPEPPHMEQDEEQCAEHADDVDDIHDAAAHADDIHDADDIDEQDQQTEFLGGSMVTYVLTQYEHHVARRLLEGELKKFVEVPVPDPIQHWIQESGQLHLSSAYLTIADAGLIYAFVEKWHMETNSVHLPFGEMTITLDNVATLLHISPW